MHFPNRGGPSRPQNTQNFELRSGGLLWRLLHARDHTTKIFVVSTKIFVHAESPPRQRGRLVFGSNLGKDTSGQPEGDCAGINSFPRYVAPARDGSPLAGAIRKVSARHMT